MSWVVAFAGTVVGGAVLVGLLAAVNFTFALALVGLL